MIRLITQSIRGPGALLGALLVLLGLLGVLISLISMSHPVGAKLADDSDPHGAPLSLVESILLTSIFAGMTALGSWLLYQTRKPRVAPSIESGSS